MDSVELAEWQGTPVPEWRDRWGVPSLRIFRRTASTSELAREEAEAGAEPGTTIIAGEQTRGRGRRGRTWHSPPGASVALSMVLRPPDPASARLLTLRLGLAAARAIERTVGGSIGIKWPNDLIAEGGKVGGILCESVDARGRVAYVVAGIGINLRQPEDGWPGDVADRAISLAGATGVELDEPILIGGLIRGWLQVQRDPAARLNAEELAEFARRDVLHGRMIRVEGEDAGVARGITEEGALRVRREGREIEVLAGTVRAAQPYQGDRT